MNRFLQSLNAKNQRTELIALSVLAFVVAYIPFVHIPFSWVMTFFHEISHGIMAFVTGGSIVKIQLNLDGSGLCYTRGGIRFLTAFAGYSGAVLWGVLIFSIAQKTQAQKIRVPATLLASLIVFSAVFYGRDVITWVILGVIFAIFMLVIQLRSAKFAKLTLKFIGLYVLFDAIRAPTYLIDGKHNGDGATLQNLLLLPEMVWVLIWLALGLAGVYWLWLGAKKA